jgi:hypothetical protein
MLVDNEQSYRWLKSGDFKGETEILQWWQLKTKQIVPSILRIGF